MQVQESNLKLNEQLIETSPSEVIQNWLVKQLAQQLSLEAKNINITEPLTRYGLDSIDAVTMVGDLEDWLDLELPSTLFWDHPTIEKSAQFLAENYDLSSALSNAETEAPVATKVEETKAPAANGKGWGNLFGRRN
jgi:acyl carrier protein